MKFLAERFDGVHVPIDLSGLRKIVTGDKDRPGVTPAFDANCLELAGFEAIYNVNFQRAL